MNQIEIEIQNELLKDKLKKIYIKYRLYIIFFIFILLLAPIFFQLNNLYLEKKNQKSIEMYSKAVLLIDSKKVEEALKILNQLKVDGNIFTRAMSINRLLEYYLKTKEKNKAIQEINYFYSALKKNDDLLSEILSIKKALLIFDEISEAEILDLLKPNTQNKLFKSTSNKILFDFYTMKNQHDKAKFFLKN